MTIRTLSRAAIAAFILNVVLVAAAAAQCPTQPAGPVVGPKNICFAASANNNVLEAGIPVVTGYKAIVKKVSDGSTVSTTDLGKPTPDGAGFIHVNNFTGFGSLTPGLEAVVQTVAYGPGGESPDGDSVSFLKLSLPAVPGTATVTP